MANISEKESLHVVIRLPFKRPPGFVEPPPIVWTEAKEQQLWQTLSQNKMASLDWNLISRQMDVPAAYLIRHAETQLRGLQQQLQNAKTSTSASGRNSNMSNRSIGAAGSSEMSRHTSPSDSLNPKHRPPRLTTTPDNRAPAMDRRQLSGSSLSGSRLSVRSGTEGGDLAPISPHTPRQPYSPRDLPARPPSTTPQSPRVLPASPPPQQPSIRNSPPTPGPMLHRGSGLGSRSSSTTSLTNLANSSLHMAASLRIRDSPPKYPTSPTYPAPQRGSPTRSPLPPIPSTPPPPARVSTASLASDGRSRSDTGSVRAEGSRYFDAVGQGLARGEREDTYHGFDADDGGRSDNSSRTGSERSESDDDADDYDEEERRRRREQPTDEIGFAAGKFTIEAEPAFLPAKGTAGAAGPGAGPEAGAGPFAIGRMDLRDIGRGKGAPVPGDIGGMGSRLSQGRVRSAAGGGAGLMSASQVLTRPPGPSSMIAPPRNPAPQSGLPTAAASAKPAMTTTTSRHTYRESSAQGTRAQPHTGGDSPNEATTSENSVGSSYSDLSDSSLTQSALEDAYLSGTKMSAMNFSRRY